MANKIVRKLHIVNPPKVKAIDTEVYYDLLFKGLNIDRPDLKGVKNKELDSVIKKAKKSALRRKAVLVILKEEKPLKKKQAKQQVPQNTIAPKPIYTFSIGDYNKEPQCNFHYL